jgi:hypothetical protein
MDKEIFQKAIANITSELDKLAAFMHIDRKELSGEETEMVEPMDGEEHPEGCECEDCMPSEEMESEDSGMGEKKPIKMDFLSMKRGKPGAFA